jgi:hypothetical protein
MLNRNPLGIEERGEPETGVRRSRRWIPVLVLLLLLFLLLFGALAGKLLVIDAPEHADVILVLAGETDRRPALAVQLLQHGYAPKIVIDVPAAATIFGFSELQLADKYAQSFDRGGSVRVCPIAGLSTRDESRDAEKCLSAIDGSRVLIVTSDFHTRRALSTFRHEIQGKTFSIAAARDNTQFGSRWWTQRQWAKTCIDEWLRIAWWNAVDRWR